MLFFLVLILAPALFGIVIQAAEFGVPRQGNPPPGYFILVGEECLQAGDLAWALGDIPHKMTLYIEVTSKRLDIDLYDPGLYDPNTNLGLQLDSSFSTTKYVGTMYYALIAPDLVTVLQTLTIPQDTNVSNRALVHFYNDNNATLGTYQLYCELKDTSGTDEDVNVFGIYVPGFHVYSYNLCVGHNTQKDKQSTGQGGAVISGQAPISLYPFIEYSKAATEGGWPVCGLDFVNYDMDSLDNGVPPPDLLLTTHRGYVFNPPPYPSCNMCFYRDHIAQVPAGELDSNDQGIWRWDFLGIGLIQDQVSPSLPQPVDMNAFSMQVYDYGRPSPLWTEWPFDPSFLLPPDDRHPRRIYLPMLENAGDPIPKKEYMGHSATIVPPSQDPPTVGFQSVMEVTFEVANPREYDMTITSGATYVNPSSEFGNPTITIPGTTMTATVNGTDPKQIDITGIVRANTTASFVYRVDVTPNSAGIKFLTGDGVDFTGGASRQSVLKYRTPVTMLYDNNQDQLGPICALYFMAKEAICTATASVTPSSAQLCPGDQMTLDGSGSSLNLCQGGHIEYQWLENGNVYRAYPGPSSITVSPTQTATYTLEVRCSNQPDCKDSKDVPITVWPAPGPVISPAAPEMCLGRQVTLTLTNPADYASWVWHTTPTGRSGDNSTSPTVQADTIGTVYTITCLTSHDCETQKSVTILEKTLAPPQIDPPSPGICNGQPVRIEVVGTYASCRWSTNPPLATGDGSTNCYVDTGQPNVTYTVTVTDADGCTAQSSVMTRAVTDVVPPALGNVFKLVKQGRTDIVILWTDLAVSVGEYRIHHLNGDSNGDGIKDTQPTTANLNGAPYFTEAPGVESYTQTNGIGTASFLVYYRIRAASECYFTPGPL
jgi:hypothetical protein